jgi:staphylococcal nuclease domain-containing protein 1
VPAKVEYIDVLLSDIRTDDFGFSVQILNTEGTCFGRSLAIDSQSVFAGIASLETLMVDFAKHYQNAPTPPGFIPKTSDLISAKFSDGQWYRAKVRRASPAKREAEVTFIDYGNRSTVPFSHTRPLDPRFKSLPPQAHDARLRYALLYTCELTKSDV